jgi:hypothetical protein
MSIRASLRLTVLLLIAALWVAAPGFAQTQTQPEQPGGPFQGLFGGNEVNVRARQTLNFTFSAFADYESNDITAPNEGLVEQLSPIMTQTGLYFGASSSLNYGRRWRRASFSAAGGTSARYYPDLKEFTRVRDWGALAFTYAFGPKTTLNASQSAWYSPYFMNGWFPGMNPAVPGQPITPGYDNYTYYRPNWQFNTAVDFQRRLTRASSASAYYSLNYIDFLAKGLYPAATYYAQQITLRYQHSLSRSLSLRAGYSFNKYRHGLIFIPDERTRGDNIELGLDYQKTLKVGGRQTDIGATGGGTYVTFRKNRYYTYLVHAHATTMLAPKWSANLAYDRNFSFVEGLEAPYATDAVTVNVGGYLDRRTNLNFSGGYTHGTGVATSFGRTYGAWTGITQLQVAMTRNVALFGQGYFYHFDFKGDYPYSPLPTRQWNRWGIRGGVTFWVPLLR